MPSSRLGFQVAGGELLKMAARHSRIDESRYTIAGAGVLDLEPMGELYADVATIEIAGADRALAFPATPGGPSPLPGETE